MHEVSKLKEILATRGRTVEELGIELRLHRKIRDLLAQDGLPTEKMRIKIAKALDLNPTEIWSKALPKAKPVELPSDLRDGNVFWQTMLINPAAIGG